MTAKRPPKPLARSAVHRMLRDDYYIGVVTFAGAKNPDVDVLAIEQARIKHERAQVAKWARAASHDAAEISEALEEALQLLDQPGRAYRAASPIVRRMLNQALFEKLLVGGGDITAARPTPWVSTLRELGQSGRQSVRGEGQESGPSLRKALEKAAEARNDRGSLNGSHGLNETQMVQLMTATLNL